MSTLLFLASVMMPEISLSTSLLSVSYNGFVDALTSMLALSANKSSKVFILSAIVSLFTSFYLIYNTYC